jgi:hypothetical protein
MRTGCDMIEIAGSPIGGENPPHDRLWRNQVADQCHGLAPTRAVSLSFRLEPHRRVDLDNLVRPALAGLRDAGVFARGFTTLDLIVATKVIALPPGLLVETDEKAVLRSARSRPGTAVLCATSERMPRDEDRRSKAAWRRCVSDAFDGEPLERPCWIEIATNATRSLEALMKPVIDGLEPLLGRDPRGRLEFVPNDDKVAHLTVRRQDDLPVALAMTAGRLP